MFDFALEHGPSPVSYWISSISLTNSVRVANRSNAAGFDE